MTILKNVLKKIQLLNSLSFAVNASLLTLFTLLIFNPQNKEIIALFSLLFLLVFLNSRNIVHSLLVTFLTSSTIFVGKTHYYQLMSLREFPYLKELYPFGVGTVLIIRPVDVITLLMLLYLLVVIFKRKTGFQLEKIDFALLLYFVWLVLANVFASPHILISLYHTTDVLQAVILHFSLKIQGNKSKILAVIPPIFIAITVFQSYLAIQQLINSAPLGKNIEMLHLSPAYGQAIDETYFTFRPIGTFIHSNNLGIYLSGLIVFLLSYSLVNPSWTHLVSFLLAFAAIVISLSRTAWISLFCGSLYFFYSLEHVLKINLIHRFKFDKLKILLLSILIVPLLIYALPRVSKTALTFRDSGGGYLRIKQAQEIVTLVRISPIFGTGSGMSTLKAIELNKKGVFTSFPDQIHNHYLLVLAENGTVGLFLLLALILFHFHGLEGALHKARNVKNKIVIYGLIASSIIMVLSAFSQPFLYLSILIILYNLKNINRLN